MFLHTLNGFNFKALHIHTFLLSLCYSNCYFISVLRFTSHQQKVLSFSTTSFFSFSVRLPSLSISPFLPATALSCTFSRTVCTVTLRTVKQRFIVLTSARKGSSSHQFTALLQELLSWQDWSRHEQLHIIETITTTKRTFCETLWSSTISIVSSHLWY